MTNHKANTVDMTTSDAEGNFVFKALPAGEYEMKVLKPGFKTYLAPQVVLEPGRDLAMTAKLQMGVLEDTVDVQAEYRGQPYAMKTMPSTETTAEPKRIRIGGNVEFSKLITKVQPIYPASAKAAGVQGTVLLHAIVSKDGRPLALQVLNSQVNPDLAHNRMKQHGALHARGFGAGRVNWHRVASCDCEQGRQTAGAASVE